ncbi:probable serine/threonine-protein phosphatase 2A regulatory subunit B'' subunit TON2 [Tanacetum coccineum]
MGLLKLGPSLVSTRRVWWETPEDGSINHKVQRLAKYRFLKVTIYSAVAFVICVLRAFFPVQMKQSDLLLNADDLDAMWVCIYLLLLLQRSHSHTVMNYEDFCHIASVCTEQIGPKCRRFFSPSNFMKFEKDESGRIAILPFYLYVMRMVSLTQARIDMSELDEDSDRFLQHHSLIDLLYVDSHCCASYMHWKACIKKVLLSNCLQKLMELHQVISQLDASVGISQTPEDGSINHKVQRLAKYRFLKVTIFIYSAVAFVICVLRAFFPVQMKQSDLLLNADDLDAMWVCIYLLLLLQRRRFLLSNCLPELMELHQESEEEVTDTEQAENWFSLTSAQRICDVFLALDKDMNGTLSKQELREYADGTLTDIFIERAFDEHLRRGKSGNANAREMDFESFLDFVLALENKDSPEGITYLFKCLDLNGRGFLTTADIHTLFRDVHQKWIEGGNYELCIEDVRDEIWDMVKPADPLRITLSDLLSCKQGGTVASMLIDVRGFWAHDNRENLLQEEEEPEEE